MAKPAWLDVQGKTWDKKRRNKPSMAPWDRAGTEAALGAGGKCKSTSWDRGGTSAKPEQSEGLTLLPVCCPPSPSQEPPHPQFITTQCGCELPHPASPRSGLRVCSCPDCIAAAQSSEQALVP